MIQYSITIFAYRILPGQNVSFESTFARRTGSLQHASSFINGPKALDVPRSLCDEQVAAFFDVSVALLVAKKELAYSRLLKK